VADRYTSRIALVLDEPLLDVGEVVRAAIAAGDLDRAGPIGSGVQAQEVNWGGRMDKAAVRSMEEDGDHLLRVEAYIGGDGPVRGMQRQAVLVQALARQLRGRVAGVRDLSAHVERDEAWINRLAVGAVEHDDAIATRDRGEGTHWVHTYGAARFDVPDLELYGLTKSQAAGAPGVLRHVHEQLLARGLKADLTLPGGEPVYLVPVLDAWGDLPFDWPGVGKAGVSRGPGLDGPRATLSLLHPPRLGKYKRDYKGITTTLPR
jgi:hypothetical protein